MSITGWDIGEWGADHWDGVGLAYLAGLVSTAPGSTRGTPIQLAAGNGSWRFVVEVADPSLGSAAVWHDITCPAPGVGVLGLEHTRGGTEYGGRWQASTAVVDLLADDDSLAPWNDDTSALFGVHVPLGAGLLLRAGMIRVSAGVVAEWLPRFTHRVESWGDATNRSGSVRRHRVTTRDLMVALASSPVPAQLGPWEWSVRFADLLSDAGWLYGDELFGATDAVTLPDSSESASAAAELDATTDPAGIVWHTDRRGVLIARPVAGDTYHAGLLAGGAPGVAWPDPPVVRFSFDACDDGGTAYVLRPGPDGFGLDDTELTVVNAVTVTDQDTPATPYQIEDVASIARFDRHALALSWRVANDPVADQLLARRAWASVQARPVETSIDHPGFVAAARLDWLDPVAIHHTTAPGRTIIDATGVVRQIVERVWPRIPHRSIGWSLSIVADVDAVVTSLWLLPVENLAVGDFAAWGPGDYDAHMTWDLPAGQPVTPTAVQVRLSPSSLWYDLAYPSTALTLAVYADTTYQADVRLVVRDDLDRVVTASPVRSVVFTTPPGLTIDPDGNPQLPDDLDPGCVYDWVLRSSDDGGSTWTDELSGSGDPGTPVYIPPSAFDPGLLYRFCITENCGGTLGAVQCSDPWVADGTSGAVECQTPAVYGSTDPYDRADLVAFVPELCTPDIVTEAVSGIAGVHGPAWGSVTTVGGDLALLADTDTGGTIAAGEVPALADTGDVSIGVRVGVQTIPVGIVELFAVTGIRLQATAGSTGWRPRATVFTVAGEFLEVTSAVELALIVARDVVATFDTETATLELWVDGTKVGSTTGTYTGTRSAQGSFWRIGAPAASWITSAGVWSTVIMTAPPSDHDALTAAIAALSPTCSWDTSVAAGNLPALSGGIDAMWNGSGDPGYQTPIGTGDLVGLDIANSWFNATISPTDNAPFSMFVVCSKDPVVGNGVLFGTAAGSWFSVGATAMITGSGAGYHARLNVNAGVAEDTAAAPTDTPMTYAAVFTGSEIRVFRDGVRVATTAYTGAITHGDVLALCRNPGTTSGSAVNWSGPFAYPAWWDGVALTDADVAGLHAASGL